MIHIKLTSVPIDDYDKALAFYTEKIGFLKKHDIPLGNGERWITVVSPAAPDGMELLLEPNSGHPEVAALKAALVRDGIPWTAFEVDDVQAEYERMVDLGVEFTVEPLDAGTTTITIFDDTCGNLIQLFQMNS